MRADADSIMEKIAAAARDSARTMAAASGGIKNRALEFFADAVSENRAKIQSANAADLSAARRDGLADSLIDRLDITDSRMNAMREGILQVAALPDPVGSISEIHSRPSGIRVGKMRAPLGVIAVIYESRPNVTADAAALCLKAGNAVILRGGSEAMQSNLAIGECLFIALGKAKLPTAAAQVVPSSNRELVGQLLKMRDYIDLVIPRGGKGLIERVARESSVPVLKHLDGNCHVYADADADMEMAIAVADNAKTNRFGVCNAMETLLVNKSIAPIFLPRIAEVFRAKKVEMRGCPQAKKIIGEDCKAAEESDWREEYLAPIIAIRVMDNFDDAVAHINHFGSRHTDAIITNNLRNADRFLREVDSSSVMVNASTRFADGFEYGLGAEVGVSTDKLHARGPVGLIGLTSEKYVVFGDGHIRA